jgi:hypothetical protein
VTSRSDLAAIAARYAACRTYADEGEAIDPYTGNSSRFRTVFTRAPFRYRLAVEQTSKGFDRTDGRGFVRHELTSAEGGLIRTASSTKPTVHLASLQTALECNLGMISLLMAPAFVASLLVPDRVSKRITDGDTFRFVVEAEQLVGVELGDIRVLLRPQLDVPIDDAELRWEPPLMVPVRDFN